MARIKADPMNSFNIVGWTLGINWTRPKATAVDPVIQNRSEIVGDTIRGSSRSINCHPARNRWGWHRAELCAFWVGGRSGVR